MDSNTGDLMWILWNLEEHLFWITSLNGSFWKLLNILRSKHHYRGSFYTEKLEEETIKSYIICLMKDIFHGANPLALWFVLLANPLSFLLHKLKGHSCGNVKITVLPIISLLISLNYMVVRLILQSSNTT